jgi:hypothetical protein
MTKAYARGTAPYNGSPRDSSERFAILRMSAEESERRRPDWHRFVYGSERNPILKVRSIR